MNFSLETIPASPADHDLAALHALLRDAVEGGASVGFLVPLPKTEVTAFWQAVLADVAAGNRIVLAARAGGTLVGSVQLELARRPNSRHRAEVQKLLVLRSHRHRGLGRALLHAAETTAAAHGRTLLVLDTSASGNAVGLYQHGGYERAGVIPRFAQDPDGSLIDTVIYYKDLAAPRVLARRDESLSEAPRIQLRPA